MGVLDNLPPAGLGIRNSGIDPKDYKGLKIHIYADKTPDGIDRVSESYGDGRFTRLVDADTGKPAPWPVRGVKLERAPEKISISPRPLDRGRSEGYIKVFNERIVTRPAGPADNPYKKVHNFVHIDGFVIDTLDGPVEYRVVRQPDKYLDGEGADVAGDPRAEVYHDYLCEKV